MPYCPACGAETAEGAANCPDCGSALASADGHGVPSRLTGIAVGFVAGLFALGAGFTATMLFSDTNEGRELAEEIASSSGPAGVALSELLPEWYHAVSWTFLENHHVDVSASVGEVLGGVEVVGTYAELLLPSASKLRVLPPLLLVGAGVLVAFRRPRSGPADAAVAGATVVAGYLPGIAVLTSVATFEVAVLGDIVLLEISPDVGRTVLVAGLAYPLVFGGLGGLLALALDRTLSVWGQ
jgi:hypothetical protein